ncbi:MAG: glutamine-hydrolyzing GMP synthase [Bacteroidetes bacterium]|jgi:GMP synthase (glutamine-hydrolysing)|nr:glutamine-hydrolyzing GMP synthase [Bacteroidota bacterium]
MKKRVIIFDFGSQYTQLIARRVRELNIFCEIFPYNKDIEYDDSISAIILSGSPFSVRSENALQFALKSIQGKYPVLAICYGAQYIVQHCGGVVEASNKREYGKSDLQIIDDSDSLFEGIPNESTVWMSHADSIAELPPNAKILAKTNGIPVAAFKYETQAKPMYGLQFHPEVTHSDQGLKILSNFLEKISDCESDWTPAAFVEQTVAELKEKIGSDHVLMALSGGVDSSVGAMLLHKAIGDQLHCFFVNNGLLRKNEFEDVLESYKNWGLNITGINRADLFYDRLRGVSDPEKKRKIIGGTFIEVFDEVASRLSEVSWLGQGTIYPDVIESVSVHGPSVTIKSHHNVGGLPEKMNLKVVEPLRMLFKDEVRRVGKEMELPHSIIGRHPFPGPGLAIRILGEITPERIHLLQEADDVYVRKLKEFDWYDKVWQAGAVLLPIQTVGVMGDERTYEAVVALRAVNSVDGMTAEWSRLPHELLADISSEIINSIKGINRVVYDISTKPPATIEWE